MTEQQCPDCNGEGRIRVRRTYDEGSGSKWQRCTLCGGTGRVDPAIVAVMKVRREHEHEDADQAEAQWLTAAVEDTFRWLVDEAGYRVAERQPWPGQMHVVYESERTAIRIQAYFSQDVCVLVGLGAPGNTGISLNNCLEAHGLEGVNPWLQSRDQRAFLERLGDVSDALRALMPYEVGGNWYLL